MMNKKIILIIIVVLLLAIGIYQGFLKTEKPTFILAEVVWGNISQEVSETGQVKKGEGINLSFKNSGRVEKIYVEVGDQVESGENLAKLETTQLQIQLEEAQASFDAQKAILTELQIGTRTEEIQISQTLLDKAKTELDSLYNYTPAVLNQAYNLADNAIRQQITSLFLYREASILSSSYYELTYKYCDNQAATDTTLQRKTSEAELNYWQDDFQNPDDSPEMLDELIGKAEERLGILQSFLNRLNDTLTTDCNLSSTEIATINSHKSLVSSALTNVNTTLTSVSGQKKLIEAQKLIVKNYQEELNLKLAGSTTEQIAYQEALVKQAEAAVKLLENQIEESTLVSPASGQITKINKKVGEMAQSALQDAVINLLPAAPFEIEVDIYEEDVVKINIGNPVEISLVPFPDKIFKGKVISINPAEKIVEGVVYYETSIDFEEMPDGLKPGMTADLVIQAALKENVLVIPEDALHEKDDKKTVQVFQDGEVKDKEIEIGLIGSNDLIEVISGLEEGEKVILR